MYTQTIALAAWVRRGMAASLLLGVPFAAMAQQVVQAPVPAVASVAPAAVAPKLTIRQIYDRLETAGYRDQSEIELDDDGRYEVKARNAQGARVKLEVDASTGAIVRSHTKRR